MSSSINEKQDVEVAQQSVEVTNEPTAAKTSSDSAPHDAETLNTENLSTKEPGTVNASIADEKEERDGEAPETVVEAEVVEDESKYPKGAKLILLSLGLAMATFVVALDNTIIATAIPTITTRFDSLGDVGWYGSAYLLTTTSLQPSFGKIYTYFNVKWTYIIALIIFEAGSVLCAAATSSKMLIVGRAVAGAGAAALFSGGMNIVGFAVPLRSRPIYIAILSSMFGIASVVGPILGGALTDKASWRWCFWINLPFGGIALTFVFLFFNEPERKREKLTTKEKLGKIDFLGAFLLIGAIVMLLLALQWGGTTYPWKDSKVYGLFIGFALTIAVFIFVQYKKGAEATIPLSILKNRSVAAAALFTCFQSMALYAHIFYLPFYFQGVKGTTAEGSGIRTIPYLVSITVSSIIIGGTITLLGFYTPFMIVGAIVFTVGAGLIYTLGVDTPTKRWIGYQLVAGIGAGAGIQVPFIAVQVVLDAVQMPSGNSLVMFANTLGGAISVSIAENIFVNSLIKYVPEYTNGTISGEFISLIGSTHLREFVPPSELPGVLFAYAKSVDTAFITGIAFGGLSMIFSCFMEWKSVKGKKLMPGGGA